MKKKIANIFLKKKILIYGLGKSGISSFKFLRNKADIYLFDDLKYTHPNQISKLNLLKIGTSKSHLKINSQNPKTNLGLDAGVICFSKERNILWYSGAKINLYQNKDSQIGFF